MAAAARAGILAVLLLCLALPILGHRVLLQNPVPAPGPSVDPAYTVGTRVPFGHAPPGLTGSFPFESVCSVQSGASVNPPICALSFDNRQLLETGPVRRPCLLACSRRAANIHLQRTTYVSGKLGKALCSALQKQSQVLPSCINLYKPGEAADQLQSSNSSLSSC